MCHTVIFGITNFVGNLLAQICRLKILDKFLLWKCGFAIPISERLTAIIRSNKDGSPGICIPLDWVRSASAWSWRSCSRRSSNVGGTGPPPRLNAGRTNLRGFGLARRHHAPAAVGGATSNDAKAISSLYLPQPSLRHRTGQAKRPYLRKRKYRTT
jgi:hypothetical protein